MVCISSIVEKDLAELAGLFEELSGLPTDDRAMRQTFSWMAGNPDYVVLGARVDSDLAGSLMGIICHDLVGSCRPFMVIENVIVLEKYRGRGIGKALMVEIERISIERGCYYVVFVSGSQRKEAHRFYESLGYRLDAVQGFKKFLTCDED